MAVSSYLRRRADELPDWRILMPNKESLGGASWRCSTASVASATRHPYTLTFVALPSTLWTIDPLAVTTFLEC